MVVAKSKSPYLYPLCANANDIDKETSTSSQASKDHFINYICLDSDSEHDEQETITLNSTENSMSYHYKNFFESLRSLASPNEVDEREEATPMYVLDGKKRGNIGRWFNHSCAPNMFVQNVFVDTHDVRFHQIAFFAIRNIKAGTELCWDYAYTVDSVKDRRMECLCGASTCRKRLL